MSSPLIPYAGTPISIANTITQNPFDLDVWGKKYSPPNWKGGGGDQHRLYYISFYGEHGTENLPGGGYEQVSTHDAYIPPTIRTTNLDGPGYNKVSGQYMFVFDGIRRAHHQQKVTPTVHPVQSGYNITDHVVLHPATLSLEVIMSDALALYRLGGYRDMWDKDNKCISAYQTMSRFMRERVVMKVGTRLRDYYNMLLVDISSEESVKTYYGGLIMTLQFQQIIVADVATQSNGVRLQSSGQTKQGTAQTTTPDQTTTDQHQVTEPVKATFKEAVAAGDWNSLKNATFVPGLPAMPGIPYMIPRVGRTWIRSYR